MRTSRPDIMKRVYEPDAPAFDAALEGVLDDAFGPGRHAKVSARVREFARLDRALSRVALEDSAPVGCCRIYRIAIDQAPALFLGPLAVRRDRQGEDIGSALIAAALGACDAAGDAPILVLGQPALFAPFGFVEVPRGTVILPGPIEARRLQYRGPTAPAGVVRAPRDAS